MTRITSLDLQPFYRNSIGIDRLFDSMLSRIDNTTSTNYPPYNIIKKDEDNYIIKLLRQALLKVKLTYKLMTVN